jgi:hypothetical protein
MADAFARAQRSFFDRAGVLKYVAKRKAAALARAGAILMRTARKLIRSRAGVSPVGSPPYAHQWTRKPPKPGKKTGGRRYTFRDSFLFAYDRAMDSVVVGPVLFDRPPGGVPVPVLLEKGGTVTVGGKRGPRTLHYRPRPTMAPALRQAGPKIPEQFR